MKTIVTTYRGPTNTKGSLIVADDGDGNRVDLHYDDAKNSDQNHAEAAKALCVKMGRGGRMQGGCLLKGGKTVGMVWSWLDKPSQIYVKPLKPFTNPVG